LGFKIYEVFDDLCSYLETKKDYIDLLSGSGGSSDSKRKQKPVHAETWFQVEAMKVMSEKKVEFDTEVIYPKPFTDNRYHYGDFRIEEDNGQRSIVELKVTLLSKENHSVIQKRVLEDFRRLSGVDDTNYLKWSWVIAFPQFRPERWGEEWQKVKQEWPNVVLDRSRHFETDKNATCGFLLFRVT
jgi:hypothetical protein